MRKKPLLLQKNSEGFTLVEVMLYFAVAATMVVLIGVTLATALSARAKGQAISDVDEAGVAAMTAITQAVRNGTTINTPIIATSGSTLSVGTYSNVTNPTILDLTSGALTLKEGTGQPIALTSNTVTVSNLIITNVSRAGTPGSVRIQFTVTRNNPQNKNEFYYTQTFYGTATLRQP